MATEYPAEAGIADYILICTKSYDLESVLELLKPSIDKNTLLLPLLNGVDGIEVIEKALPNNIILNGCVYIISRLKEAGVVENMGYIQKLYFGLENTTSDKLVALERLLFDADIEATLSEKSLQSSGKNSFTFHPLQQQHPILIIVSERFLRTIISVRCCTS